MGDRSAFFYGSLMAPEILFRVAYGRPKPEKWQQRLLTIKPAMLHGYCRRKVRYCDYPVIIPSEGDTVRGTYVTGLTEGDIWRLDIFEGDQYERIKVKVRVLDQDGDRTGEPRAEGAEVEAETYVWIQVESGLEEGEWDYAVFRKQKMRKWIGRNEEYEELDEAIKAEQQDPTGGRRMLLDVSEKQPQT